MREQQDQLPCDLLVIGGGINGAGIARDAAGRGLSVVLCEKDDLAAHTSSASTKLIHGGLRYLEYNEFGLVRKALIEREVLLRSAPHIMRPLRFVMPHDQGQRPSWLIRAGLFLYDSLARRELLPGSRGVDLRRHPSGAPLDPRFTRGFVYSDGWVDDARLVVLNAIDAAARGARILTRTACVSLTAQDKQWRAVLQAPGAQIEVHARCVVNATGPWAVQTLQNCAHHPADRSLRLIKGSHIVVQRLFDHPYAYIFQHPDGRIVFAIPYERNFTLIGTTDIDYHGDPNSVAIEASEVSYLCDLVNRYFKRKIGEADVVWSYSGVRPLVEDEAGNASAVTRDYRFEMDMDAAPMLSIFGGKITTFRKLAEEAVDQVIGALQLKHGPFMQDAYKLEHWTGKACLPGGDLFGPQPSNRSVLEFERFVHGMQHKYSWLPATLVARYAHAYGTRIDMLLDGRSAMIDMGEEIAPGLHAAEVVYLLKHEWAKTAADILWRRSKLGLHLPTNTATILNEWLRRHHALDYDSAPVNL